MIIQPILYSKNHLTKSAKELKNRKKMSKNVKVCVTGGAGYIASYLIKLLLERGYTVHATLRNLNDASKVGLLKALPHAETNLKLFEANIYNSIEFAAAIEGCTFVLHLATLLQHDSNSPYKDVTEAAVAAVKIIAESCIKSKTVKRLIYTSSVVAAAPLKEDGSGYKDVMDEECWTPLDITSDRMHGFLPSRTLPEKEALAYNGKGIEVVTLALPLVAGDTIQSSISNSMTIMISQPLRDDEFGYKGLRDLEDLTAKVPFAHVRDVVEAHIFSMENPHINGRFIVANSFLSSAEIASIILKLHPDLTIPPEFIEEFKREIKWGARKLQDLGFEYQFDAEKTIDATIVCAKRMGTFEGKHHAKLELKYN